MNLTLTREAATELDGALAGLLRELSHEIADTDNAGYRRELLTRRELLSDVAGTLHRLLGVTPRAGASGSEDAAGLVREIAHPGD